MAAWTEWSSVTPFLLLVELQVSLQRVLVYTDSLQFLRPLGLFLDSNSINATRNCLFRETCIIGLTVEINCINPNTKWRTVVFSLSENFSPNRNHVAAIRPIGKMKNSKIITIIKVVDFKAFFSPLNLALASSETWQARIRFSWRLASLYTRTWRQMIELNNAIVTTVTGIIVALDKKR